MSGGHLDYFFGDLERHVGDFGDRELDDLVRDLAKLFYAREWFLSGDTCEGDWNEARDAFKAKWFGDGSQRERIEQYLDDVRREVIQQMVVTTDYCKNCTHWRPEEKPESVYGWCDHVKGCMMHRSETCGQFERRT